MPTTGKPHATTFRLSDDEQKLSWDGAGLGKLNVLKGERYVRVSSFLELLVGHESAVFQRSGSAAAASNMHLSLSLVLSQALPARPSMRRMIRKGHRCTMLLPKARQRRSRRWLRVARRSMRRAMEI